ncbi:hypothetical protein [uncultured Methanobrevibacter sp.]|uniref:hypothetical protein n=1 Tax=uncultured Methanobrevibacter sp. TaxID=253161 RepID=UPI0025EF2292|nr:hypothetical protein [uncultured Methanobrevibacter sp.]
MQCHYHPEREGTDVCAICGKTICKECGLEIAGKIYCKECLEKIVGLSLDNSAPKNEVESEPVTVNEQPIEENIYQQPAEPEITYAPQEEPVQEYKVISDDSPYNIKDNIEYSGGLESSYLQEGESIYQEPQQITPDEPDFPQEEIPQEVPQETLQEPIANEQEYIYPDHDYEPPKTTARQDLEDKYEKYLDDLYFEENEVPLGEQLAKDEEQYGSLTKKEYPKREVEVPEKPTSRPETPEEMEARIRAEIANEQGLKDKKLMEEKKDSGIHNLNYQNEKEPMGIIDIILTLILIIVILIVLYYIIYLFILQATYPTFMDAVFALKNPQNVVNAILSR